MAARPAFGTPTPTRRRPAAAFALGAVIAAAGLAAFVGGGASAHGPFAMFLPGVSASQPGFVYEPLDPHAAEPAPRRRLHREHAALVSRRTPAAGGREPVCVRLCDGYFFPLPVASGDPAQQAAACGSLCPDAPTEVYYRNGADNIESAVSLKGSPYKALPVSLRYQAVADNTCACHRDVVAYQPLRDPTLRAGDAVMTPAGFVVFHGAPAVSHAPAEFTALRAAALPSAKRGALQAMETASLEKAHATLGAWFAQQTTPRLAAAHVERVAMRATKGDDRIRLLVWRDRAED